MSEYHFKNASSTRSDFTSVEFYFNRLKLQGINCHQTEQLYAIKYYFLRDIAIIAQLEPINIAHTSL